MEVIPNMISLLLAALVFFFVTMGAFPIGIMIVSFLFSAILFGVSPMMPKTIESHLPSNQYAVTTKMPRLDPIQLKKRGPFMNTPLSEKEIKTALNTLPGWTHENNTLFKRFQFQNFREAISFIVRLSFEAEAQNHHPELKNVYSTLEIRLNTHDANNQVTQKDLHLAHTIEEFNWLK
jgi:4a-hydroxytetrahydrobiopterin dehydratase